MWIITKCLMGEKGERRKKREKDETGEREVGEERRAEREWVEFGSASGRMAITIPHVSFVERQFVFYFMTP